MNVLVIPEDSRKDQYVLKPIIERMMSAVGVKAKVRVCADPLLGGIGEALKWGRIEEILERYRGMVRLFLLIVDRDGVLGGRQALDGLEERARDFLDDSDKILLAENAWQEIEVWVLAGVKLQAGVSWAEVRADPDPKERYFLPYAKRRGVRDEPYEGRATLAKEAAGRYPRLRQLCPEDVGSLEDRIRSALAEQVS